MLLHIEPAHVRKEKPSSSVVRIGILLRVLVVHAVVARPVVDGTLVRHRVDEHHEHADGPVGIVGAVRPETVDAAGDAEPTVPSEAVFTTQFQSFEPGRAKNTG